MCWRVIPEEGLQDEVDHENIYFLEEDALDVELPGEDENEEDGIETEECWVSNQKVSGSDTRVDKVKDLPICPWARHLTLICSMGALLLWLNLWNNTKKH